MKPFVRLLIRTGTMLLGLAACITATAQTPLPLPNLDLIDDGSISDIVRQPDGGVVFCGKFSSVGGVERKNIARLLPSGVLDPKWNPGLDSDYLCALAVDDNGAVYVGGSFLSIAGTNRLYLAKLTGSGTAVVDENWQPDAIGPVTTLKIAGDELFADGAFFYFGDSGIGAVDGLAKISLATGMVDPDWHVPVDGLVFGLEVAGDAVYAGGQYTSIGRVPRNNLARLDRGGGGTVDPDWDPSPNYGPPNGFPSGTVWALQSDGAGHLYVGGHFYDIAGQRLLGIARFSTATGAIDPTWKPRDPFVGAPVVTSLAVDGDRLYAACYCVGAFMQALSGVVRVSTTGAGAFEFGWANVRDGEVSALALNGSSLLAGGKFMHVNGRAQSAFARLGADGALLDTQVDIGIPGQILAIARQPDGGTIVGGRFARARGWAPRNNLLRLWPDGRLDTDWLADTNGPVYALDVGPANTVYVGGNFTQISNVGVSGLARLDSAGLPDASWHPALSPFIVPQAIAADSAGNTYVAAHDFRSGGFLLDRFDAAGVEDPTWNSPSLDGAIADLALDGKGFLYTAGYFTHIGGRTHERIARLAADTGAVDDSWNPSVDGFVRSIALRGNSLYAGGAFTIAGGQPRDNLAKFTRSTGAVDPGWKPATTGTINAVAIDAAGAVYAGGEFSTNDAPPRINLARFGAVDGSTDPAWIANADLPVDAIGIAGGSIVVGGRFSSIGGAWRHRLAALPDDVIFRDGFEAP